MELRTMSDSKTYPEELSDAPKTSLISRLKRTSRRRLFTEIIVVILLSLLASAGILWLRLSKQTKNTTSQEVSY